MDNTIAGLSCLAKGESRGEICGSLFLSLKKVIPQVNLTRTDMDILGDIAEELAECGCFLAYDFLRRVQSEVTKIVEYQEER